MRPAPVIFFAAVCCLASPGAGQPVGFYPLVGTYGATPGGFGDADNVGATASAVHGGHLFMGTMNTVTGAEVWRTADGYGWTRVNTDSFGSSGCLVTYSMASYKGSLYAGTWSMPFALPSSDTRIWRWVASGTLSGRRK